MTELTPCRISLTCGADGAVIEHFYTPDAWSREYKEGLFPEYAWHNADFAAYYDAYAAEMYATPKATTAAYRFNLDMVTQYGGLRPELVAAAVAARSAKSAGSNA